VPAGAALAPAPRNRPRQISFPDALAGPIVERIAALEKQVSRSWPCSTKTGELIEELRCKDRELALRETEIEKAQARLVYQKKLLEKEIEDRARVLDEKWALMDREVSERISRERDGFEKRLAQERSAWSERLANEQEKFAATLPRCGQKRVSGPA